MIKIPKSSNLYIKDENNIVEKIKVATLDIDELLDCMTRSQIYNDLSIIKVKMQKELQIELIDLQTLSDFIYVKKKKLYYRLPADIIYNEKNNNNNNNNNNDNIYTISFKVGQGYMWDNTVRQLSKKSAFHLLSEHKVKIFANDTDETIKTKLYETELKKNLFKVSIKQLNMIKLNYWKQKINVSLEVANINENKAYDTWIKQHIHGNSEPPFKKRKVDFN